jgi:hypothetical protein
MTLESIELARAWLRDHLPEGAPLEASDDVMDAAAAIVGRAS